MPTPHLAACLIRRAAALALALVLSCPLFAVPAPAASTQSADAPDTASLPLGMGSGVVLIAEVDNRVIGPITAEYIETMIARARHRKAECLIIKLDTPGGLLESTKRIVGDMLNAEVPIAVWVAPSGSRAASAGMFITMAGHVAAMAPGTHIGAAHPVNVGGGDDEKKEKDDPFVKELRRFLNDELERKKKEDADKNVFRPIEDKKDKDAKTDKAAPGENVADDPADAPIPLEEAAPAPDAPADPGDAPAKTPPDPQSTGSVMGDKVLNDTVAWAHNIADLRGRNGKWAELAVRASVSATEDEALALNVVDLIAGTESELLQALHGRVVTLPGDKLMRLDTRAAAVERVPMSLRHRILDIIVHPQIALFLMGIGMIGIFVEFTSPGIGVPGVAGAIFFIIGLYAMSVLPVNYAGLLLLALAVGLFIAEAKVGSYGLLTFGGLTCMVLGMLMLIRDPAPFTGRLPYTFIIPVSGTMAAITVGLVTLVLRTRRTRVATGPEGMAGTRGVAVTDIAPRGRIEIGAETWSAVSATPITKGEAVVVKSVSGLTCTVEKAE